MTHINATNAITEYKKRLGDEVPKLDFLHTEYGDAVYVKDVLDLINNTN